MARQTTNYGLTKPDYTDIADIEVVNSNMDIIDEALKVIDTKSNNVMSKNSSAWSSTVTYAVGQYCIYNNSLWKCLVQHSGQTPQEGTYWARVSLDTLGSEINALNSNIAHNAGAHNGIYRGAYLGNTLTDEQKTNIANGTFKGMYIGDYWTIGEINYRIAHFDYWLRSGDIECTKHHIIVVPDNNLYTAKMNDSNITTGGYVGSKMYTEYLAQAKTTINNAFGSTNILNHRELLANATKATSDSSYETAGAWYDSTVELMTEEMVYGGVIFHNVEVNGAIPYSYTIDKTQLALFRLDPSKICNRANWWMRDVVSSAYFALVNDYGSADASNAFTALGVRPAFGIVGN